VTYIPERGDFLRLSFDRITGAGSGLGTANGRGGLVTYIPERGDFLRLSFDPQIGLDILTAVNGR